MLVVYKRQNYHKYPVRQKLFNKNVPYLQNRNKFLKWWGEARNGRGGRAEGTRGMRRGRSEDGGEDK